MNLISRLYEVIKERPEEMAIRENREVYSYSDLWDITNRISVALVKIGLKEGDRVAVLLPNSKEFIFSLFALMKNNIIAVPLKHDLTLFELEGIFYDCSPSGVITIPPLVNKVIGHDSSILDDRIVILSDDNKQGGDSVDQTIVRRWKKVYTFHQLYSMSNDNQTQPSNDHSQLATINYTYRGYGYPVGACISHRNYIHSVQAFRNLIEPDSIKRSLLLLPAYHIFPLVGSILFPLLTGGTVVTMRSLLPRHIFNAVSDYNIDYIVGVPTLYRLLLKNYQNGGHGIASLKSAISGGSLMSIRLHADIKEVMCINIMQGYGMTEALPVICNPLSSPKPYSIGVSWNKEVKVKIVNGEDKELGIDKVGEIVINGPNVMSGYYNDGDKTRSLLKDGWFYTGDYGLIDREGYLHFKGLKKGICKVGGNAVDLREVKRVLSTHPAISNVKIDVRDDDLWGNIITAEVYTDSEEGLSEKELKRFCHERLSIYKIPRRFVIKELNYE